MFKGFEHNIALTRGFTKSVFPMNNNIYGIQNVKWALTAEDLVTLSNTDPVNLWRSRFQVANYTQSDPTIQPSFIASDSDYNGYPSVQASGNQRLINLSSGVALVNEDVLIWIGRKTIDPAGASAYLGSGNSFVYCFNGGTSFSGVGYFFNPTTIQGGTKNNDPMIVVMSRNKIILNGTVVYNSTGVASTSFNIPITQILGANGTSQGFTGTFCAAIIVPNANLVENMLQFSSAVNNVFNVY
jgi:hypothetical protein